MQHTRFRNIDSCLNPGGQIGHHGDLNHFRSPARQVMQVTVVVAAAAVAHVARCNGAAKFITKNASSYFYVRH